MKISKFQFALFGINTYVVVDEASKQCAIIDPGMTLPEERQAIADFIESNHLTITHVINTHLHIDHVAGNDWLAKTYGAEIYANEGDLPIGRQIRKQAEVFGLPYGLVSDVTEIHNLKEGDIVEIGEGRLEVLQVPGHSPGSIVLYDREDGFVVGGDVLFAGSIGRTDLYGGSMPQLIDGIRKKLLTLPPSTIVYPGHGPATTIGREAKFF